MSLSALANMMSSWSLVAPYGGGDFGGVADAWGDAAAAGADQQLGRVTAYLGDIGVRGLGTLSTTALATAGAQRRAASFSSDSANFLARYGYEPSRPQMLPFDISRFLTPFGGPMMAGGYSSLGMPLPQPMRSTMPPGYAPPAPPQAPQAQHPAEEEPRDTASFKVESPQPTEVKIDPPKAEEKKPDEKNGEKKPVGKPVRRAGHARSPATAVPHKVYVPTTAPVGENDTERLNREELERQAVENPVP